MLLLPSAGLRRRCIRDPIAGQYGVSVSAELISKLTDAVHAEIREWQSRPLPQLLACA